MMQREATVVCGGERVRVRGTADDIAGEAVRLAQREGARTCVLNERGRKVLFVVPDPLWRG